MPTGDRAGVLAITQMIGEMLLRIPDHIDDTTVVHELVRRTEWMAYLGVTPHEKCIELAIGEVIAELEAAR